MNGKISSCVRRTWAASLWLVIAPMALAQAPEPAPAKPASSDGPADAPSAASEAFLDDVAAVEELTLSLEEALGRLGVALLAGDRSQAADLFAEEVATRGWPASAPPPEPEFRTVHRRDFEASGEPRVVSRNQVLDQLKGFLALLPELETVSFEVLGSERGDAEHSLVARVSLDARGRNGQGQREWLRGEVTVRAKRLDGDGGRFSAFVLDTLSSLVSTRDLFVDVTRAAGVSGSDLPLVQALEAGQQWYPNAGAAADVNGDGLLDLFVTGPETNSLYLNQGDGTFRDAAASAGLQRIQHDVPEFNPVFFDRDNDGDLDLFVTSQHRNVLLDNRPVSEGRVLFRNASLGLPQRPEVQGWSVAVGDVDGNARPDLYVVSYFSPMKGPYAKTSVDDVEGAPNLLYLNRKDGTFEEAAERWGVADTRFGMAAQFVDIDWDFDLDLYVANDFGGGNNLYIHHGDRYVDEADERGARMSAESMGVSFADYDNDGDLDLHVTNMSSVAGNRILDRFDPKELRHGELLRRQWEGNVLLENRGDGTFVDVSRRAGPFPAEWAWGGGFLDFDNDGWEDLHTPNGFLSGLQPFDARALVFGNVIRGMQISREETETKLLEGMRRVGQLIRGKGYSLAGWTHDRTYWNRGDGTFLDVSGVAGADSFPSDARSTVYADFDNDGDHDIFVRATHGRSHFLFRNDLGQDRPFLRVTLEGRASGRDAFGALVRVKTPSRTYVEAKRGSNGYLAQSDPRLLFGLGEETEVEWVEVRWPAGHVQRFDGPFAAEDSLLLVEGAETARKIDERRFTLGER